MGSKASKQSKAKSDDFEALRCQVLEGRRNFLDWQLKQSSNELNVPNLVASRPPLLRKKSELDELDGRAACVDPRHYSFPFENIVLEGGGNKGLAYCGAVQVLEELRIWQNVKRLAGASAGAMTAALLAVGCNSNDIEEYLSQDLSRVFLDHQCGYLSLLPNLLRGYGWNPGKRIFQWFGQQLKERTGDEDVTFEQVYKMFGRELCVVVTNLNTMMEEYCHPKTTPDMPVRLAVRMSMAIPGMFCATKWARYDHKDTFVDGGVLCNYPIHCFDGWWLSMKPNDSFLKRLQPIDQLTFLFARKERFGNINEKTLGFVLYADNETDLHRYHLDKRIGMEITEFPKTKLAKKKTEDLEKRKRAQQVHRRVVEAVDVFLKVLNEKNCDENWSSIAHGELLSALNDTKKFSQVQRQTLFGNADDATIVRYLDRDGSGEITYQELVRFMEDAAIHMQTRVLGYERREVKSFLSFLDTLQCTILTNVKRVFVQESDLERTVGINTGHVGTSDFTLEDGDRKFVVEQGRKATLTFLKYYVVKKGLRPCEQPALDPIAEHADLQQPSISGERAPLLETDQAATQI